MKKSGNSPSPFKNQYNQIQKNGIKRKLKTSYVVIDSSKREKSNQIVSKKIDTIEYHIKIYKGNIIIILLNPLQFENKQIQSTIQVLFKWVILDKNKPMPKQILGMPSSSFVFEGEMGTPVFDAKLIQYEEDSDRAYYHVVGLCSKINGFFSGVFPEGQIEIRYVESITYGYPHPNKYKINLQQHFKNVVSVKMISSMFPTPCYNYYDLDNINYFIFIDIPELLSCRNIYIPFQQTFTLEQTFQLLIQQLAKVTEPLNIYPVMSIENYMRIHLLHREVRQDQVKCIPIGNQTQLLFTYTNANFPIGNTIIIHSSEHTNDNGIYRIIPGYCYRVTIQNNSNKKIELYQRVYLENKYVGIITSVLGKNQIEITTDKKNELDNNQIIITQDRKMLTIINVGYLGSSIPSVVTKLCHLPKFTSTIPSYGVFSFKLFRLSYECNSFLTSYNIQPINEYTYSISDFPKSEQIDNATLKDIDENTFSIEFTENTQDNHIFQVTAIEGNNFNKGDLFSKYESVLMDNEDNDGNTRVFLEHKNPKCLTEGLSVKTYHNDSYGSYGKIIEFDEEDGCIVLDKSYDEKQPIVGFRYLESHSGVLPKENKSIFMGYLIKGVLRGENHIYCKSTIELSSDFIIQIGNVDDGSEFTSAELNVIEHVKRIKEDDKEESKWYEYMISLKYPISNSWLKQTSILLKYVYLEIEELYEDTIFVYSELPLDKIDTDVYGILNWNSFFLYEHIETNDKLTEEHITITEIEFLSNNEYKLKLSHPLSKFYSTDETYYIVLFLNHELEQCEPSTINYERNNEWYTKILIQDNHTLQEKDNIIIYDMEGENIPKFGLSDNDSISRKILDKDLSNDEDNLTAILREPSENQVFTIEDKNDIDNSITIKGKYMGYNGYIQKQDKNKVSYIDTTFCDLIANKTNHDNRYTVYFNKNILPMSYFKHVQSSQNISIKIRELDIHHKPLSKLHNYQLDKYFYVCNPLLGNMMDIPKINSHTQSLKGWSITDDITNTSDKLISKNNALYEKDLLQSIFNVVHMDDKNPNYIYNSFTNMSKDLSKDPIKELYELEFVMLWKDGRLIDFNNIDHSFTLEIVEEDGTLDKIHSRTGNSK